MVPRPGFSNRWGTMDAQSSPAGMASTCWSRSRVSRVQATPQGNSRAWLDTLKFRTAPTARWGLKLAAETTHSTATARNGAFEKPDGIGDQISHGC